MLGETNQKMIAFRDIAGSDLLVFAILIVLIIGIGIYPKPLLHLSEAAVSNLIEQVKIGY